PQGQSAANYVDALFANVGATPAPEERDAAINAYGTGDTAGRVAALQSVILTTLPITTSRALNSGSRSSTSSRCPVRMRVTNRWRWPVYVGPRWSGPSSSRTNTVSVSADRRAETSERRSRAPP